MLNIKPSNTFYLLTQLLIVMILSIDFCFTQSNDYNFSEVLYPDIERITFGVTPNFNYRDYRSDGEDIYTMDLDIGFERRHISNSRDKQISNNTFGQLGYHNYSYLDVPNKLFLDFSCFLENRYFFPQNKYFEIEASTYLVLNKPRFSYFFENRRILRTIISPKIGWGRIENISDSWHALAVLKQLKKNGFLSRDLSSGEFQDFSKLISELQNLRNPDFRLERIAELTALNQYFVDNDLANEESIGFYAELGDAYFYEGFVFRGEGTRFDLGPRFQYVNENLDLSTAGYFIWRAFGIQLEYEKNKAINDRLQFDYRFKLFAGQWYNKFETSDFVYEWEFYEAEADFSFDYYMSRRTYFFSGLRLFRRGFSDSEAFANRVSLNFNAVYYFSPKLRYNLSTNLNLYNDQNGSPNVYDDLSTNISIRMNYYFR